MSKMLELFISIAEKLPEVPSEDFDKSPKVISKVIPVRDGVKNENYCILIPWASKLGWKGRICIAKRYIDDDDDTFVAYDVPYSFDKGEHFGLFSGALSYEAMLCVEDICLRGKTTEERIKSIVDEAYGKEQSPFVQSWHKLQLLILKEQGWI